MNTIDKKGHTIAEIAAGSEVRGLFLLGAASQQQARNGPFWRLELRDATGSLEARIWSPLSQQYVDLISGQLVELEGRADVFREQVQLSVGRLRVLPEEECAGLDLAQFLLASDRPAGEMLADIEQLCKKELRHKPWRKLMDLLLKDETIRQGLLTAPGATSVHHAWVGGLVEHLLGVANVCMALADLYPDLDRQILLVGALTHDLGKLWELSGGLANEYTDEGRLMGHISIGLLKLEPFLVKANVEPELALHLRHLILSHHGLPEYGSPREPHSAEAFALHHADNVDAKIVQLRTLFSDDIDSDEASWSPYQKTLGRAAYRAARTPKTESGSKARQRADAQPKEEQCSLL